MPSQPFPSVWFSGCKYVHVVQPPLPPISTLSSSDRTETPYPLNNLPLPAPRFLVTGTVLSVSVSLTLLVYRVSEIIQHFSFCDWLHSLSKMSSRFIHIEECVRIWAFFLRLNNHPPYVCATFCLSTYLSTDTWVAAAFWLL